MTYVDRPVTFPHVVCSELSCRAGKFVKEVILESK